MSYNNTWYAFDATDVSKPPLWHHRGTLTHFGFPVVTNGKVFFPAADSPYLKVFGLRKTETEY